MSCEGTAPGQLGGPASPWTHVVCGPADQGGTAEICYALHARVGCPRDALSAEARRWGPGVSCVGCGTWVLEDVVRFHVKRAVLHLRARLVQGRIAHLLSFDCNELWLQGLSARACRALQGVARCWGRGVGCVGAWYLNGWVGLLACMADARGTGRLRVWHTVSCGRCAAGCGCVRTASWLGHVY